MLYRIRRTLNLRRFDRAIAGILATKPIEVTDPPFGTPLAVVSMVANRDVPMYVAALKSFYPKLGGGKVVAIVDRDMPQALRDTLAHHIRGIEFAILEDIPTAPCQRGGTWERLLFCLDRSEREYTIQIDADTLCVGADVDEVVACVRANRAFTMADGFARQTLPEAAAMAEATPSGYIGMATERAFARYPGGEHLHYIRGSSGFAGFARGGYTRARINVFHQEMERLVGEARWREWGSEQCGSNWAVANSPDPVVLPYPEYASFNGRVLRHRAKLFHFIGRFRFVEGYLARRTQEVIAALTPGAAQIAPPPPVTTTAKPIGNLPLAFARLLLPSSLVPFLRWKLGGRSAALQVQMRGRREFRSDLPPGPRFELRGKGDYDLAHQTFVEALLFPPVWIPPERVELIVDCGAEAGMSCLWWLSNYWRARVIAFEPQAAQAAQTQKNVALNGFEGRLELHRAAATAAAVATLGGRHIDILKLGASADLLDDPGFGALSVGAAVLAWRQPEAHGRGGREWYRERLERLGYRTYVTQDRGDSGVLWGYRDVPWGKFALPEPVAKAEPASA